MLYTDGVIEARDGAGLFGEKALLKLADGWTADPLGLPQAVFETIAEYSSGELPDDVALLAIHIQ